MNVKMIDYMHYAPEITLEQSVASCSMLTICSILSKLVTVSVTVLKHELLFMSGSQWTALLGYLSVSYNNMLDAIVNMLLVKISKILSFSNRGKWCILHSTQSMCRCSAKLSTFFFL